MNDKLWNRDFTLLTLSNFLMCCAYYSLISTLPVYISHELLAPESLVGLVMASYVVAAILIRPFCGFSLDKYGRKAIFLASLLIYAFTFNGYLIATSILMMTGVRFVHGMTWGLTTTSNSTVAGDIIPGNKRGEGFGYFGVSTTAGMALGPMIGAIIFQHGGYTAMFLAGCLISLVSMGLAALIRYPAYYMPKANLEFKWKNLVETSTVIPSLNLLIIMLTYGGLISFVALFGHEIGIGNPSGFFLIYAIGIISSRFAVGKALDRNGPRIIIMFCLSLLIIGFPLLALWQNQAGFFTAALILGFGNGVVFPTFQTMTNNMVPASRRGAASSTLFIAVDIGMGLGMILVGVIAQYFSISTAFLVCSGIGAAGLAMFLITTLKYYQHHKNN
ncbi:MAG: MFS transporter [Bacteroidetes bacterium]|nr:MFS transporter [Bacteroidota bacterium]